MIAQEPKTVVVQKFGGASVATPEKMKEVARRVVEEKKAGRDVIVVISAMGDTTDRLLTLAKTVNANPPKRELDMLLTAGERISMALLSMAISDLGYEAISFTGSQSGIVTDTSHTRATILDVRAYRVREELEKGRIVIVAGFQGVSPAKEITTLGRGGSDTTCVALAAAFSARECHLFKDVDGIYTADPRIVPWASRIDKVSYEEMMELAFCGAGVLHWRSVDVAMRLGVRVQVRPSFGKEMGTVVTSREEIEAVAVRGITQDTNLARVSFKEVGLPAEAAGRVLEALDHADIEVRFLHISACPRSLGTVSVMIPADAADAARSCLAGALPGEAFTVDEDVATVSVVGHGLTGVPGISRKVLGSLASLAIDPDVVSSSGLSLTIVLPKSRVTEAVRKLHIDLGLGEPTTDTAR
jgi:aspartate kinase